MRGFCFLGTLGHRVQTFDVMQNQRQVILRYLATHHPFDQLPGVVLAALSDQIECREFVAGEIVLEYGAPNDSFYLIRKGAVEVLNGDGVLIAKLAEGDMFGHRSLLADGVADDTFRTIEDTVLYRLGQKQFHQLYQNHAQFQFFLAPPIPGSLTRAAQDLAHRDRASVNLTTIPLSEIIAHAPVTLPSTATVLEAARLMTQERVSSLMIVDDGRLTGIITDRDLRSRVLAKGLSVHQPLSTIMTTNPAVIDSRGLAYDALLTMAKSGFHHLPVLSGERIAGMITDTDLIQRFSASPLYFIGDLYQAKDVEGLVALSRKIPQILVTLVDANASALSIGQVVSSIGEAINIRLLELGERQLGPPPVPYTWLTGGSLARREQTAQSDQDNCLLLSDAYEEAEHSVYFQRLSRYVCDGLNACGYIYCPGEVMATTPKWRQPMRVWKSYFNAWVDAPEPMALMHICIFFDLQRVYGNEALFTELQSHLIDKAHQNKLFHAYMASNALQFQPPLGFFRNFVLVKDGKHDHTLDLKLRGVVPIIDIARVYALAYGIGAVNTVERLESAQEAGVLSATSASDLTEALEFISTIRLRHQARQIRQGIKPDNFVPPQQLSHLERKHLKDAFLAVRTVQAAMAQRYQTAMFG